jgi:hypothetical protein
LILLEYGPEPIPKAWEVIRGCAGAGVDVGVEVEDDGRDEVVLDVEPPMELLLEDGLLPVDAEFEDVDVIRLDRLDEELVFVIAPPSPPQARHEVWTDGVVIDELERLDVVSDIPIALVVPTCEVP